MFDADKRKTIKEKLAPEVRSYFDRLTPTSKFATFEVADFDALLDDIVDVFEKEAP